VAFAEEIFHDGEAVSQVANGGFLHVIHFSITDAKGLDLVQSRNRRNIRRFRTYI
jgi:hypothetical protein